jgi:hypothetical protein
MPDLKQSLRDFVATSNSGNYKTEGEVMSKFPELKGYDITVLRDFVATSNSGKYKNEDEVFAKFPEFKFSTPKKKVPTQVSKPSVGSSGTTETPQKQSSGSLKQDGIYKYQGNLKANYKKENGQWYIDPTGGTKFQPLAQGDVAKRVKVLESQANYDADLTAYNMPNKAQYKPLLLPDNIEGAQAINAKETEKYKDLSKAKVFTGFPTKEENKYRVVDGLWQRSVPNEKGEYSDWSTVKSESSIKALNGQFKQNVNLDVAKTLEEYSKIGFKDINSDLIGGDEGDAVPMLNNKYKSLGFSFREGLGDQMIVTSSIEGVPEITIDMDSWDGAKDAHNAARLKAYLSENALTPQKEKEQAFEKKATGILSKGIYNEPDRVQRNADGTLQSPIMNVPKIDQGFVTEFQQAEKQVKLRNLEKETGLNMDEIQAKKARKATVYGSEKVISGDLTAKSISSQNKVNKVYVDNEIKDINLRDKYTQRLITQYENDKADFEANYDNYSQEEITIKENQLKEKAKELKQSYDQSEKDAKNVDYLIQSQAASTISEKLVKEKTGTVAGAIGRSLTDAIIDSGLGIYQAVGNNVTTRERQAAKDSVAELFTTTTSEFTASEDRSLVTSTLVALTQMTPAIAAGVATGGATAGAAYFWGMSYSNTYDSMEGLDLPEEDRKMMSFAIATATAALESYGLEKITSNKAASGFVAKRVAQVLSGLPKEATMDMMNNAIYTDMKKVVADKLIKVVSKGVIEGGVEVSQSAAEQEIKNLYEQAKKKDVFQEDWGTFGKNALKEFLIGSFAGSTVNAMSGLGTTVKQLSDPVNFGLSKEIANDEDLQDLFKNDLKSKIIQGEITIPEAKAKLRAMGEFKSLLGKVPSNMLENNQREAMKLIEEKQKLQREIEGKEPSLVEDKKQRIVDIDNEMKQLVESESVIPDEISSLNDDEQVIFNVETLEEVPEQFRDRAVKKSGMEVTLRKKILGLPIGKKTKRILGDGYRYELTGKEAKDYAVQERSTEEVLPREQEQAGETGGQREGMGQSLEGQEVAQESAQKVEDLRAQEQAELIEAIPNAEQYMTDGKVDRTKITNPEELKTFDNIYKKYDEIITPLIREVKVEESPKGKITVFRGIGNNVAESENGSTLWVAEDEEVAKNYAGTNEEGLLNVEKIEIEKPTNPIEMPYKLATEVRASDIGNNLRSVVKDLYKNKKISKEKLTEIIALIKDFETKAGNNLELFTAKLNKKESAEAFSKIAQSLGFDGVVQKESATRDGDKTNTYGIFKNKYESILLEETPVVEQVTIDDVKTLDTTDEADVKEVAEESEADQMVRLQNLLAKSNKTFVTKVINILKKTGLAKKVSMLNSKQIENKLKSLGINPDVAKQVSVWHGSPYSFDKFTTAAMGTGEGAQAFGWGLYFTDLESIAKGYAKALASLKYDGKNVDQNDLFEMLFRDLDASNSDFYDYETGKIFNLKKFKEYIDDNFEYFSNLEINEKSPSVTRLMQDYEYRDEKLNQAKENYRKGKEIDFDRIKNQLLENGIDERTANILTSDLKKNHEANINYLRNAIKYLSERDMILKEVVQNERNRTKSQLNYFKLLKNNFDKFDLTRNLYKVSLHKGKQPSEYDWLQWDKELTKDQMKKILDNDIDGSIAEALEDNFSELYDIKTTNELLDTMYNIGLTGSDFYKILSKNIGENPSGKDASLALLNAGIDGIKYPAESISRGATSETARGFNYVVFDENAITIEEQIQFQKALAKKGVELITNGFVHNGEVYINSDNLNPETPIHEFSHLFNSWLKENNKELYNKGIALVKAELDNEKSEIKDVIDYVKSTQPDLKGDALLEEILTQLTGEKGAELIKTNSAIGNWLKEFWKSIKDKLGLLDVTPEQLSKMTVSEFAEASAVQLLKGQKIGSAETGTKFQKATDGMSAADIVRIGKANGIANSVIKKYLKDNGYTNYTSLFPSVKVSPAAKAAKAITKKPAPKMVTVDEMAALKDQIRLEARAARGAKANIKENIEKISTLIKSMVTAKGDIKQRHLKYIFNKLASTNLTSDESVDKLLDYIFKKMTDANYLNKLDEIEKINKAIKNNKNMVAEIKYLADMFTKIDLSKVSNIDKHLEIANKLKESLARYTKKTDPTGVEFRKNVNYQELLDYVSKNEDKLKTKIEKSLSEVYDKLFGEGASDGMSDEDMIKNINEAKADKVAEMRDIVEAKLEDLKNAIDEDTPDIVKKAVSLDPKLIPITDLIDIINGITMYMDNGILSGMKKIVAKYDGLEAANKSKVRFKQLISILGKNASIRYNNLFGYVDSILTKKTAKAGDVEQLKKESGYSDIELGYNKSQIERNKKEAEYKKKFGKIKNFNRSNNIVERRIISHMQRELMDSEKQGEYFLDRKKLIESSVKNLKASNDIQLVEEGKLLEESAIKLGVLNKDGSVNESSTMNDINSKTQKFNLDSVKYIQDMFSDIYEALYDHSLGFYNTLLERDVNYTPDVIRLIAKVGTDEDAVNKSDFSRFTGMLVKKAGILMKTNRPSSLTDKYISLNFDQDMFGAYEAALRDLYTSEYKQKFNAYRSSDAFNDIMGKDKNGISRDAKLVNQRYDAYVNVKEGNIAPDDDTDRAIKKFLNTIGVYNTAIALGSLKNILAQSIPTWIDTMVSTKSYLNPKRAGNVIIDSFNPQIWDFVERANSQVALRGKDAVRFTETVKDMMKKESFTGDVKKISGKILNFIPEQVIKITNQYPDKVAAIGTWMAYYREYCAKNKIPLDLENPNADAVNYAETKTKIQILPSDAAERGKIGTENSTGYAIARQMLFPFSSFAINSKNRIYGDLLRIFRGDTLNATSDMVGAIAGVTAFQMINHYWKIYVGGIIASALFGDDEDEEELAKRIKSSKANSLLQGIQDFVSPMPILDPLIPVLGNKIISAYDLGLPEEQEWNEFLEKKVTSLKKKQNKSYTDEEIEEMKVKFFKDNQFQLREQDKLDYLDKFGSLGISSKVSIELFDIYQSATTGVYMTEFNGKPVEKILPEAGKEKMKQILYAKIAGLTFTDINRQAQQAYYKVGKEMSLTATQAETADKIKEWSDFNGYKMDEYTYQAIKNESSLNKVKAAIRKMDGMSVKEKDEYIKSLKD